MPLLSRLHLITLSTLTALAVADFHVFNCVDQYRGMTQYISVAVASNQYGCNTNNLHNVGSSSTITTDALSWYLGNFCGKDQVNAALDQTNGIFNLSGSDGSNLGFCNPMEPQGQEVSGCGGDMTCTDDWVCYSPVCN